MWAGILSALKAIGSAFGALFTWLSQRELIDAGRQEAERDALERAANDRKIADEIDREPVLSDKSKLLDGLLRPEDRG